MVILDTDYLTFLQWPASPITKIILDRLKQYQSSEVAATIISFEEQIHGRLEGIRRKKELKDQIEKYRSLRHSLQAFCAINILDFDELAAIEFQRLRKQYRRLGTMDLKIAAI